MIRVTLKGDFRKEVMQLAEKARKDKMNQMVDALAANTPVDTGEARDGWRVEGESIVNDVEHIESLNKGSSDQAPTHFIEQTLLSQQGVRPSGIIVRSR